MQSGLAGVETVTVVVLFLAFLIYPLAAVLTSLRFRAWPLHRCFLWSLGILTITFVFTGPLADAAQKNFVGHMWTHLLLGMLAPLLLLLSMPMTLLMRTMPIAPARKLSAILKSRPFQLLSHPVTALFLNSGGLYMLYLTNAFQWMHESTLAYILIHLHVFLAGYLYTASIIYIDLAAHRLSYLLRAIVLIASLAAHKILSKFIYANPPAGVSQEQAEAGGMVMYYGGDLIELAIIFILCWQWYKSTAPRRTESIEEV